MKVFFETLGCKVNSFESEGIKAAFEEYGFEPSDTANGSDVLVVNSCAVTKTGENKSKQTTRRFRRENPDAIVVLTGCFPQALSDKAAAIYEADIVTGTKNRKNIPSLVLKFLEQRDRIVEIESLQSENTVESLSVRSFGTKTRAYLKVQDGCDNFCSYCIIPTARGPVRSKSREDVICEAKTLAAKGYKEIVLVGINLFLYGRNSDYSLVDVIVNLCSSLPDVRFRLGSIEPELLTRSDAKRLSEHNNFCPHFHLSLQSGCDKTLAAMRRKYDTSVFSKTVENIRAEFKSPTFTTDIIVGFPGESEQDFRESYNYVKSLGFLKVHIFPYSKREGTAAALMKEQIEKSEKSRRLKELLVVCEKRSTQILDGFEGEIFNVLFESESDGYFEGFTENYIRVYLKSQENLCGEIKTVKLKTPYKDGVFGEIVYE